MPWNHCDVPFILDDEVCPVCKLDKGSWTVQLDKTRTLVIGLPKRKKAMIDVELRDPRGNPRPGRAYRAQFASGLVKQGPLDARAQARFEQLSPGPCQVTFPEEDRLERGARFDLARPLAEAVRAEAAPAPLWKLERVARVAAPMLQAAVATTLLPPPAPASQPAAQPPADGAKVKVEVPLRVTFGTPGAAQDWLRTCRLQAHVDGEQVPCGAFVAPDPAAPGRVVVRAQLRVEPGSRHVLLSTRATARGSVLRTVLLSERLEVEGAPTGAGAPAAAGPTAPGGTAPAGAVLGAAQPMALSGATWAGAPTATAAPTAPTTKGQPQVAGKAIAAATPGQAGKTIAATEATPTSKGLAASKLARGKAKGPAGPYAAHAAAGGKLLDRTFAPEPIGLSREQIERGAGERYVFQPETDRLEAALPLRVTFGSTAEAQRWLLGQRLQVHVDGQQVPCGAFVVAADRVVVQFRLEPGDRHVLVSTRATARGAVLRTVLASQRLAVEADGAGSGPPATPSPGASSGSRGPSAGGPDSNVPTKSKVVVAPQQTKLSSKGLDHPSTPSK